MYQAGGEYEESESAATRGLRWWVHLLVLTTYPVSLGALGVISNVRDDAPMLPPSVSGLLLTALVELLVFGGVFSIAWFASRARASELLLAWTAGVRHVWRGLVYSIVLRGVLMLGTALMIAVAAYMIAGGPVAALEHLRPEVENVVNAEALADPVYFVLTLTVISFVVAGFREELWRAGMLAGFAALFPQMFQIQRGRIAAAAMVAIAFGLGHVNQGLGGVLMTTALGLGLGLIILRHRSIWDAVFAHGFFNATTFAFLYVVARYRPEFLPSANGL
jgi:membrane protease YdiL (CAAX protease family)